MVNALKTLETEHDKMRAVEKAMAGSTANGKGTRFAEQLERLRHQRLRRPRTVLQHSVSNRTGKGLTDLQVTLKALIEDKRLFSLVGMQVPLNYSMLERLAQEGRDGNLEDDVTIVYRRAHFCNRDLHMPQLDVVLCEPEQADADLRNSHHLKGKVAVVKRGGNLFHEKTQRVTAAGALGLVIVNTEDALCDFGAKGYSATIPVVMIKAKDAQTLLESGN